MQWFEKKQIDKEEELPWFDKRMYALKSDVGKKKNSFAHAPKETHSRLTQEMQRLRFSIGLPNQKQDARETKKEDTLNPFRREIGFTRTLPHLKIYEKNITIFEKFSLDEKAETAEDVSYVSPPQIDRHSANSSENGEYENAKIEFTYRYASEQTCNPTGFKISYSPQWFSTNINLYQPEDAPDNSLAKYFSVQESSEEDGDREHKVFLSQASFGMPQNEIAQAQIENKGKDLSRYRIVVNPKYGQPLKEQSFFDAVVPVEQESWSFDPYSDPWVNNQPRLKTLRSESITDREDFSATVGMQKFSGLAELQTQNGSVENESEEFFSTTEKVGEQFSAENDGEEFFSTTEKVGEQFSAENDDEKFFSTAEKVGEQFSAENDDEEFFSTAEKVGEQFSAENDDEEFFSTTEKVGEQFLSADEDNNENQEQTEIVFKNTMAQKSSTPSYWLNFEYGNRESAEQSEENLSNASEEIFPNSTVGTVQKTSDENFSRQEAEEAEISATPEKIIQEQFLQEEEENFRQKIQSLEKKSDSDISRFERASVTPTVQFNKQYVLKLDPFQKNKKEFISNPSEIQSVILKLEETLNQFNIDGRVVGIQKGPIITRYEIKIPAGIKVNRLLTLTDELAMALEAMKVRIEAPIPGRSTAGIEIPNKERQTVLLGDLVNDVAFKESNAHLPLPFGKDIAGNNVIEDLVKMPHLLIAGATGSGKSVAVNAFITSLILNKTPEEVRFILVDPKLVELSHYNDIPHLLHPVITDHQRAILALNWAVEEMERRYEDLLDMQVRDIRTYNEKIMLVKAKIPRMPYIVVLIDELGDLMMVAGKDVESSIVRLTQKARAVGIHLILATQRPSVDVITALIKANCPARISLQVAQKTDSRTILDGNGAEQLLGKGDMLFKHPSRGELQRIQCPYVGDREVEEVVRQARALGIPNYITLDDPRAAAAQGDPEDESLMEEAWEIIAESQKASASYLQRRLRIGYNRAARIIEAFEAKGWISAQSGSKPREILGASKLH